MSNIETISKVILQETCKIKHSVSGYNDDETLKKDNPLNLDGKLKCAFENIQNSFEGNGEAISFISFADTELKENNIDKWIVEPDGGHFFYAAIKNSIDSEKNNANVEVLNDYYYFKDVLKKTVDDNWPGTDDERKLLSIPRSAQLAYVLNEPFTYRILCANSNDDIKGIELTYENKILHVTIPTEWFKWDENNKAIDIEEYKPINYNDYLYEVDTNGKKDNYPSAHADVNSLKSYIESISEKLREAKVPIKERESDQSTDIYADGFARLIISLAYLSKLLNCWVESIPSVVAYVNNQPKCLGVFIWGYYGDKHTKESPYSLYFQQFSEKLCACYANKYIKPLQSAKQVRKAAIKSAVADIMSRNMSHNLGSHYLYYTKKHLADLADSFDEKGPDIRGAAQTLGYIQARMDYLATIVAGEKYPYGSVYFKGQIFDEITIDDFSKRHFKNEIQDGKNRKYKRTTNYLLQNLILSENFTRNPVVSPLSIDESENDRMKQPTEVKTGLMDFLRRFLGFRSEKGRNIVKKMSDSKKEAASGEKKQIDNHKLILLQVLLNGEPFTGISDDEKDGIEKREKNTKLALSKICVALPGGIMSIHAFFNVVENLIRNSAKYLKEDFKDDISNLIVTIDIKEDLERSIPSYIFTIFDNKNNALKQMEPDGKESQKSQSLIDLMNDKLSRLSILTNENELEKSDKGLKEILFSTLWMRAYTYEKSKKMSDVLFEIESKTGNEKLMEIKDHAFEYVAVDEKGQEGTEEDPLEKGNLGIRFSLPQYRTMKIVNVSDLSEERIKNTALNSFMDIICIQGIVKEGLKEKLGKLFTRIYYDKDRQFSKNDENKMKSAIKTMETILERRFGKDFNQYRLIVGGLKEADGNSDKKKYGIYFVGHLENKKESEYRRILDDYYYCESISGGNFTKTIETIFGYGTKNGTYDKEKLDVKYFGLKVKEAALTRITLIDERFYKNMNRSSLEKELTSAKNVRLLNLKPKVFVDDNPMDVLGVFDGNSFNDSSENKDHTHFLSIHLGMIEKIVDDDFYSKALKLDVPPIERDDILDKKGKRAIALMKKLKDMFKAEFISVHSGRGNFSKDLEGPLRDYQFISVSALESVLTNSKFLLAQLFYNTVYIGKGVANE